MTRMIEGAVMRKLIPEDIGEPRVYFTQMSPHILINRRDREKRLLELTRDLKILVLFKQSVVIPASNLVSNLGFNLFNQHPELLDYDMVIPALRSDIEDIDELVEDKAKRSRQRDEIERFYREHLQTVVSWEQSPTTSWFKEAFIKELKTSNSVIRVNLCDFDQQELGRLISAIEPRQRFGLGDVHEVTKHLPIMTKRRVRYFAHMLYHLSGGRTVGCESYLPQENYIQYDLSDLRLRRTTLSNIQVFWQLFVTTVLESLMIHTVLPVNLIDGLSFEEIVELRSVVFRSSFPRMYELLVNRSIGAIQKNNPESILYDAREILDIREKIVEAFKDRIALEADTILAKTKRTETRRLLRSTSEAAISIMGLIPLVSMIIGMPRTAYELYGIFMNTRQQLRCRANLDSISEYITARSNLLKERISELSIRPGTELIDSVNVITQSILHKITLPFEVGRHGWFSR